MDNPLFSRICHTLTMPRRSFAAAAGDRMNRLRDHVIRAGLGTLALTGQHRWLAPGLGGLGVILTLHHVRPPRDEPFQPNLHLEITPESLRTTLAYLRAEGIDIITLDDMRQRLLAGERGRRFACLTLDDGYRDNRDMALPILRAFDAPCIVYVASDFAEGRGRLWWLALERLIAGNDRITVEIDGDERRFDVRTPDDKHAVFTRLNTWVATRSDDRAAAHAVGGWCARHGIDIEAISGELCMSWDELRAFAADPLVTIGAHTVTHCNLARQPEAAARVEMADSRARISAALGREVRHLAYPYGYRAAAAGREFALAAALGFATAVTTRPGAIFSGHAGHLTALPRISLNGRYQDPRFLPPLISGTATTLWNGFRRLNTA